MKWFFTHTIVVLGGLLIRYIGNDRVYYAPYKEFMANVFTTES